MNNITNEIVAIKTEVCKQNWETMVLECQQSGMSVKEWCRQNRIARTDSTTIDIPGLYINTEL